MIESLESFDRSIIIFFNGQHSSLLDQVMWFLSGPWLVFILLPFLYFIFQSYTKVQITWILLSIVLTIVLTDQLSDCTITHIGGSSPFDIKCEIKSNDFYLRWLTTKFGERVSATVERYVGFLKFEVKSSTIHSYPTGGGMFRIGFTNIEKRNFDKLYVAVSLPTSIEVFLYDGDSGTWTKNSQKGENLIYAVYGTEFGIPQGRKNTGPRPNLLDLKTDWQEVWTVIKQKKMNQCKHIASIRF